MMWKKGLLFLFWLATSQIVLSQNWDIKILEYNINDVVYVAAQDRLYGSMAGGPSNGNSLCVIDPYFGSIEKCYYLGSEPKRLTLSPDNRYIYFGLDGERKLRRFDIANERVDSLEFSPLQFGDYVRQISFLQEFPEMPIVVTGEIPRWGNSSQIVTVSSQDTITQYLTDDIRTFCPGGGSYFYGANTYISQVQLMRFEVTPEKILLDTVFNQILNGLSSEIEYQNNRLYTGRGKVFDVAGDSPVEIGRFDLPGSFRSVFEPMPDNKIYFIAKTNRTLALSVHNKDNFERLASLEIPLNVEYLYNMVHWGEDRVAIITSDSRLEPFNTGGRLILINSCISTLTEKPPISPSALGACRGETIKINGLSGEEPHYWSNLKAFSSSIDVTENGDYFYRLADDQGCLGPSSDTINIRFDYSPPDPPVIYPSATVSKCPGQDVVLRTNYSNRDYEWSTGSTENSITISEAGQFSVREISDEGCYSDPTSITVIESPEAPMPTPEIEVCGPLSLCSGSYTILSAPEGFSDYTWSNFKQGRSILVTNAGQYSVEMRDGHGCLYTLNSVAITRTATPQRPFISEQNGLLYSGSGLPQNWHFNGEEIVDAEGASLFPFESGFYTVQTRNGECLSESSIPYLVIVNADQSLSDLTTVSLYPNPTSNVFTLELGQPLEESYNVFIRNSLGQVNRYGKLLKGQKEMQQDLSSLAAGIYLLEIRNQVGKIMYAHKIIKD